jgi:SAM-dependent methyltransferase
MTTASPPVPTHIVPSIFDGPARALRMAARRTSPPGFFATTLAQDLIDRIDALDDMPAAMAPAAMAPATILSPGILPPAILIVGDARLLGLRWPKATRIEHLAPGDDLQLPPSHYSLIISTGLLDVVDDLPGVLVQMRRALVPGGRFLANMAAAPSLPALRQAVMAADTAHDRAVARFHPLVDVLTAGDLLARTGFVQPVADLDSIDIAYSSLSRLLDDLREGLARNLLVDRFAVTRAWLAGVDRHFSASADHDGRTLETVSWVTLSGQAPG